MMSLQTQIELVVGTRMEITVTSLIFQKEVVKFALLIGLSYCNVTTLWKVTMTSLLFQKEVVTFPLLIRLSYCDVTTL